MQTINLFVSLQFLLMGPGFPFAVELQTTAQKNTFLFIFVLLVLLALVGHYRLQLDVACTKMPQIETIFFPAHPLATADVPIGYAYHRLKTADLTGRLLNRLGLPL